MDYFQSPDLALAELDNIEGLIEVAEVSGREHVLFVPLLHKAIGLLLQKQKSALLNADEEYAWAYALYCLPDSMQWNHQIESHLKSALRLNPNHAFAQLYLGHLYFDMGQFEPAYEAFTAIASGVLNEQYQQFWREVKRIELIISCTIHLNRHEAMALYITQLFDLFEANLADDHYLASPVELIAALQKNYPILKEKNE